MTYLTQIDIKKYGNHVRFRKAIEIIEAIPNEQLALLTWLEPDVATMEFAQTLRQQSNAKFAASCNTIACAAGWLCLDHKLNALGLQFVIDPLCSRLVTPSYEGLHGYNALAQFFQIDLEIITAIFYPRNSLCSHNLTFRTFDLQEPERSHLTDKQLWLHRAYTFLAREADSVMKQSND